MTRFLRNLLFCALAAIAFDYALLDGMAREQDWREGIRITRCAVAWIPGYCVGIEERSWLDQITARKK